MGALGWDQSEIRERYRHRHGNLEPAPIFLLDSFQGDCRLERVGAGLEQERGVGEFGHPLGGRLETVELAMADPQPLTLDLDVDAVGGLIVPIDRLEAERVVCPELVGQPGDGCAEITAGGQGEAAGCRGEDPQGVLDRTAPRHCNGRGAGSAAAFGRQRRESLGTGRVEGVAGYAARVGLRDELVQLIVDPVSAGLGIR